MKKTIAWLFVALLSAPAGAEVEVSGGDSISHQDSVNVMNGYAIPLAPMEAGAREIKLVPAYVTLKNNHQGLDEKLSGFGLGVSYFHGFSRHWGLSLFGAFSRLTGDTFGAREFGTDSTIHIGHLNFGNLVAAHRTDKSGHGLQGAAALVYDPTSGERFRLPILLGFGMLHTRHSVDATFPSTLLGQNLSMEVDGSNFYPGVVVGISSQFQTGPVRWAPFLSVLQRIGGKATQTTRVRNAAGAVLAEGTTDQSESSFPTLGIVAEYVPWGLSFSWVPNVPALTGSDDEPAVSVFSLTKRFSWTAER